MQKTIQKNNENTHVDQNDSNLPAEKQGCETKVCAVMMHGCSLERSGPPYLLYALERTRRTVFGEDCAMRV